jgi:hypothetical protein
MRWCDRGHCACMGQVARHAEPRWSVTRILHWLMPGLDPMELIRFSCPLWGSP